METNCTTEAKELPPAPQAAVKTRAARPKMAIMQITDAAAARVAELLAGRGKPSAGIRIGVRARGCSGMTYTLEFADAIQPTDEVVTDKGVTVLIDPKATLFLLGTVMDFVSDKLQSGFTFKNPNEKGRCGCGESFHV
jgi:iron-sulfur cluster assembly protein